MLKIGVLISGGGTNLQSVIDACENKILDAEVSVVVSSSESAFGLERAKNHNIKNVYIGNKNYKNLDDRNDALVKVLEESEVDLVVLAGYLSILHKDFIKTFKDKILNIHPSLIPKYSGKGHYGMKVHEGVIENSEEFSGATVHFVDENIDTGQIVLQESIRLNSNETKESLQKRVLEIEHRILVNGINKFIKGEI